MNDAEITASRGKAEYFVRSKWPHLPSEEVSDFGAYCVEQWLSGRHPQTSYQYLGIDYLRKHGYRCGTRGSSDLLNQTGREVLSQDDEEGQRIDTIGMCSPELGRFEQSFALRDPRLRQNQRITLILVYEWGFNLKEVGDLMGVSESRISQVLASAVRVSKEGIQTAAASINEGDRQQEESGALSHKVQKRFFFDAKTQRILANLVRKDWCRIQEKTSDEPKEEALLQSFEINAF